MEALESLPYPDRTLVRDRRAAERGRTALSARPRRVRSWRSAAASNSGCASAARPARGHGPEPLLPAYDPGHPYLHWTCALCPQQVFWGGDLEDHTAQQHPGWTAEFEILQPYPQQR